MQKKYAAFISYRHKLLDTFIAILFHRKIEHYRIPRPFRKDGKRHLGRAFRDRDELSLGNDLDEKIRKALDESEYLLVVCTPHTPASKWCCEEINYFLCHHEKDKVFLVLADGTPDTSIPPQLLQEKDPLCADLTIPSRSMLLKLATAPLRISNEFLRLAASMLVCNFDDLKQRQRRNQRWIFLASSILALGIIGMLTVQNVTIRQQNQEISDKNIQIVQQLEQILWNESEALALVSTQQLEEGDRRGALSSAVQGLPFGENQRPYNPEAEASLIQALYAYQQAGIRFDTRVQQESDIQDIDISDDGQTVITLDPDGCVRCFHMQTQSKQWSYFLRSWNMDPAAASAYIHSIQILEEQQAVLCVDQWAVTLLSLKDGSVLQKQDQLGAYYSSLAQCSPDGNWLTVMTHSGMILYDIRNNEIKEFSLNLNDSELTVQAEDCCYSADGKTAAALFSVNSSEPEFSASVVTFIDLESLEGYYVQYSICGQDARLVPLENGDFMASCQSQDSYQLLCISSSGMERHHCTLDVSLPASTYHSSHPADAYLGIYKGRLAGIYSKDDILCWIYDNIIIAVSSADGSLLWTKPLPQQCLWGGRTDHEELTYVLVDGTINRITPEKGPQEMLALDCGFPVTMARGNSASCFTLVPKKASSSLLCLVYGDNRWGKTLDTASLSGEMRVYRNPSGNQLLILADENSRKQNGVLYNTATEDYSAPIFPGYYDFVGFSSLDTELIFSGQRYDIAAQVSQEAVYDEERMMSVSLQGSVPLSDQREGKPLLSADIRDNTVCWWLDGTDVQYSEGPCPDMTVLYPDPYWDNLAVGQNGLIAMQYSDAPEAEAMYIPCPTTCFALLNVDDGTWTVLQNPVENTTMPARICLGVQEHWMAFVDEYSTLRIYDQASDTVFLEADIGIGATAVDQMNFIKQDQFLLITQINGTMTVVDTASGTIAASWSLPDYQRDMELGIYEDGDRLFLCETGGNLVGMYVDMGSWTIMAKIPGLSCWLSEANSLVLVNPESGTVTIGPLYSTQELVDWALTVTNPEP